jgi:hypothetical protein
LYLATIPSFGFIFAAISDEFYHTTSKFEIFLHAEADQLMDGLRRALLAEHSETHKAQIKELEETIYHESSPVISEPASPAMPEVPAPNAVNSKESASLEPIPAQAVSARAYPASSYARPVPPEAVVERQGRKVLVYQIDLRDIKVFRLRVVDPETIQFSILEKINYLNQISKTEFIFSVNAQVACSHYGSVHVYDYEQSKLNEYSYLNIVGQTPENVASPFGVVGLFNSPTARGPELRIPKSLCQELARFVAVGPITESAAISIR